jgi:hypothetical protein
VSYDIQLVIDTGGPEPAPIGHGWNYTANCAPMWRAAGIDFAAISGSTVYMVTPDLECAIETLKAAPERFRTMDPPNGWGSYDTLLPALEELLAEWKRHPMATVEVSR